MYGPAFVAGITSTVAWQIGRSFRSFGMPSRGEFLYPEVLATDRVRPVVHEKYE
jgi:hypothetical protein